MLFVAELVSRRYNKHQHKRQYGIRVTEKKSPGHKCMNNKTKPKKKIECHQYSAVVGMCSGDTIISYQT